MHMFLQLAILPLSTLMLRQIHLPYTPGMHNNKSISIYFRFNGTIIIPKPPSLPDLEAGMTVWVSVFAENGQGASFELYCNGFSLQVVIMTSNTSSVASMYQDYSPKPGDQISFWGDYSNGM